MIPRFPAEPEGRLSEDMAAGYRDNGLLVLEGFVEPAACEALTARAGALVRDFEPDEVATVFSTLTEIHAADDYFAASGDKIRFFFEEEAFDRDGRLRQAKEQSINKIGHALHDLDPVFAAFSRRPAVARLVAELGVAAPLLLQSMVIFKQPRIGGEVTCHQDASFLHTEPSSVLGLWFALEDATVENGCLWALPGRHDSPLRSRFRRDGRGLSTEWFDRRPWPEQGREPIEAKRGTLVVLHGHLPHLSGPNRSARSRLAYSLHVIDGRTRYLPDNWLQRPPDMPLRGF